MYVRDLACCAGTMASYSATSDLVRGMMPSFISHWHGCSSYIPKRITAKGTAMEQTNTAGASSASGRSVMDRVRSTATEQLSNQKTRATDGLGSMARAVRQTAQPLRDNQQDAIAQYVEEAADKIERMSTQLRDKDVTELVSDAQRFARQHTAVFIGSAFAVGVLAARFLKSSNPRSGTDGYGVSPMTSDIDDFPATSGPRVGSTPYTTGGM